ncbi:MAG TPA: lysophospholipid acyltransferase family protein [Thermoanaerobaculia bacterium]|nr:lysophospholipid acyltransferase family protein [Thermoanaerobaculia bacterium]
MGTGLLSRLAGAVLALHRATLRTRRVHFDRYLELKARGVPILFALWHGRMFLPIHAHRHEGIVTMASRSKDGEIIARWLERNGYSVVRGSTTRGGSEALRQMVRRVRAGAVAALTVDGPTGPPRKVQPGIVQLARLTGGWILPITSSSARPRFLASWDRYLLPKPFSENVVLYGPPFPVGEAVSDEEAVSAIASALDLATREADGISGITPPEVWTRPGNRTGLDSGYP